MIAEVKLQSSPLNQIVCAYRPYLPGALKRLLLSGEIQVKGDAQLKDTKHVVVIRHYESKTIKCRYAIDVIHESYLEQYLDLVEREAKEFVNLIRRHKKIVLRSIEQLSIEQKTESSKDERERHEKTT